MTLSEFVTDGSFISTEKVTIRECIGTCPSATSFTAQSQNFVPSCNCCRPSSTETVNVLFRSGSSSQSRSLTIATGCQCIQSTCT